MFPLKRHPHKSLMSLNRRLMEEEFLHWAQQFNDVGDYNIALRTLYRSQLSMDSCQEMWWNRDIDFDTVPHESYANHRVTSASLPISTSPGGDFCIDWSINLKSDFGADTVLRAVPYAAGKILWAAADKIENEWSLGGNSSSRAFPIRANDGAHSLSGQCNFSSLSGSFECGIVLFADEFVFEWLTSQFKIKNPQIVVRRVI